MKKIKFLILLLALTATGSYAQEISSQKVSQFKEGTQLSQPDVAFLSMVSNVKVATTRGAVNKSAVKVKGTEFTVGQTLSKEDATKINSAVKAFTKTHKGVKKTTPLAKSRGDICWQWYYYCDAYGHCYYYKYYYYCY
ncbi:MAG: hypothetical protein ABI091_12830 [Ferruginibacter sp.]